MLEFFGVKQRTCIFVGVNYKICIFVGVNHCRCIFFDVSHTPQLINVATFNIRKILQNFDADDVCGTTNICFIVE